MKELKDISWQVSEPEYRDDPALSFSTLARYEREGRFSALPTLFDKLSTPSLTFGSMVDTLITGSEQEFRDSFIILDEPNISESLQMITRTLVERFREDKTAFDNIPDSVLAQVGKDCEFYSNDKYANYRVKLIRESCKSYYSLLMLSEGKTVVTSKDVEDARRCVHALKESQATAFYFAEDDPFNPSVRRYYQLKFKGEDSITHVKYRCMADCLLVDYDKKEIIPIDLKTSSHNEWDFPKSFVKYRYDIQAKLYWRIIKQNLLADEYFKDFKLLDWHFIVVNRNTCKPFVWKYNKTQSLGEVTFTTDSGYTFRWRDPYVIGKELNDYLTEKPEYPVYTKPVNDIIDYLIHS